MRTAIIIAGGFLLLGLFLFAARWLGAGHAKAMVLAAQIFIPVWIALAGINMWIGVSQAGYSVAEELPILLLIVAPPAAAAGFSWWKFS
jgi:Flp pilus assembly protein protease CpaA